MFCQTCRVPEPDEYGLAHSAPQSVVSSVAAAWSDLVEVVQELHDADAQALDAHSRHPNRNVKEHLILLGAWDDARRVPDIVAEAKSGRRTPWDQAALEKQLLSSHASSSPQEVMDALQRALEDVLSWSSQPSALDLASTPAQSPLGALPLLTVMHASVYRLACTLREIGPESLGDDPRVARVVEAGAVALVDTTGGIARRKNVSGSLTVVTETTTVRTTSSTQGWRTEVHEASSAKVSLVGPVIHAQATDLIDITINRAPVAALYQSGDLKVQDLPGLMRLAPVLEGMPGAPINAATATALKLVAGAGSLFSRFKR